MYDVCVQASCCVHGAHEYTHIRVGLCARVSDLVHTCMHEHTIPKIPAPRLAPAAAAAAPRASWRPRLDEGAAMRVAVTASPALSIAWTGAKPVRNLWACGWHTGKVDQCVCVHLCVYVCVCVCVRVCVCECMSETCRPVGGTQEEGS